MSRVKAKEGTILIGFRKWTMPNIMSTAFKRTETPDVNIYETWIYFPDFYLVSFFWEKLSRNEFEISIFHIGSAEAYLLNSSFGPCGTSLKRIILVSLRWWKKWYSPLKTWITRILEILIDLNSQINTYLLRPYFLEFFTQGRVESIISLKKQCVLRSYINI